MIIKIAIIIINIILIIKKQQQYVQEKTILQYKGFQIRLRDLCSDHATGKKNISQSLKGAGRIVLSSGTVSGFRFAVKRYFEFYFKSLTFRNVIR